MADKMTSIKITTNVAYMQKEILKVSGLSKTVFHRRAIDHFLEGDMIIDKELKITKRTDPGYVRKPIMEHVYLDAERRRKLESAAAATGVGITTLILQAIMDYCVEMAQILPAETLKEIMEGNSNG